MCLCVLVCVCVVGDAQHVEVVRERVLREASRYGALEAVVVQVDPVHGRRAAQRRGQRACVARAMMGGDEGRR